MSNKHHEDFMAKVLPIFKEFYSEGSLRDKTTGEVYFWGRPSSTGQFKFSYKVEDGPMEEKTFAFEELDKLKPVGR